MPWHVEDDHPECAGWAVVKDDDPDRNMLGCHDTEAEALDQVQALYVAEQAGPTDQIEDVEMATGTGWTGPLVVEATWSGDGRQFAANALTWADLPLPLKYQPAEAMGHDGAVIVGRIDSIERDGNALVGRGVMDDQGEHGAEAVRLMRAQMLRGVSIMADDTDEDDIEYVLPDGVADEPPGDGGEVMLMGPPPKVIIHKGRIRSATLVAEPAFAEATLTLTTTSAMPPAAAVEVVVAASYTVTIPEVWPEQWFQEPAEAPPVGAVHITPQGRIFGYLGPSKVPHRAFRASGRQVTIPRGIDYSEFQNKPCLVAGADGQVYRINAGSITFDCGHPSPYDTRRQDPTWAAQHYDNSCSIAARVKVGENEHGTWVAGGLLHGITPDTLERMMGCALSGDWQGGKLNAALLVPVEGFPVAAAASIRVRDDALVASTVPILFDAPEPAPTELDVDEVFDLIASAVGRDDDTRWNTLLADTGHDESDRWNTLLADAGRVEGV